MPPGYRIEQRARELVAVFDFDADECAWMATLIPPIDHAHAEMLAAAEELRRAGASDG